MSRDSIELLLFNKPLFVYVLAGYPQTNGLNNPPLKRKLFFSNLALVKIR